MMKYEMSNLAAIMPSKRVSWFFLLLILTAAGVARYGLLDVPLERDEGEYAYAAQLILSGSYPYAAVYNMKFPGTYFVYAVILSILGDTHQDIHFALLLVNGISILFLFLLAGKILNSFGAIFAAASFAVLSLSPSVQGMFANAEHFVVVFALAGIYFILLALESNKRHSFFIAGLLLGTSVVMKQNGILFVIFGIFFIAYHSMITRPVQRGTSCCRLLVFLAGVGTIIAVLFLWLVRVGIFDAFRFWTIDYAGTYVGQVPIRYAWRLFSNTFSAILRSAPLLCAVSGFGLFLLPFLKKAATEKSFFLLLLLFSLLSICPGLYFRPHYFILLLPCASLLAGMAADFLIRLLSGYRSGIGRFGLPVFLVLICLGQAVAKQSDLLFHMTPFQISRLIYDRNPFPESLFIADFIREHSDTDDQVAILGSEPQILFYAKRKGVSGYIYMYPLMEKHAFAAKMRKDFIQDIEDHNPRYLVLVNISYSWLGDPLAQVEILKWFMEYRKTKSIQLVGSVELFYDHSNYSWGSDARWPVHSNDWVVIFERKH
ncbi:MAG: glycosyltransferase family 39 protein [Pseudomonadota bacterium]